MRAAAPRRPRRRRSPRRRRPASGRRAPPRRSCATTAPGSRPGRVAGQHDVVAARQRPEPVGSDSHVARPMITACPIVSARKCARSSGRCHGQPAVRADDAVRATAARHDRSARGSDGDRGRDRPGAGRSRRPRRARGRSVDDRAPPGRSRSSGSGYGSRDSWARDLLDVVVVDVAVAAGPHEVADLEAGHLGDHVGQQRVGRDVERHAEEQVGRALVELAGAAAVGDVELEERVARARAPSAGCRRRSRPRRCAGASRGRARIASSTWAIWST